LTDASEEFDEEAAEREIIKYKVVERPSEDKRPELSDTTDRAPGAGAGPKLDASLFLGIALGFGVAAATGLVVKFAGRPEK
jgi:hypothetical protein